MASIKSMVTAAIESEINCNRIVDLLQLLKSSNTDELMLVIKGLGEIFCHYLTNHLKWFTGQTSDVTFIKWMKSKYNFTISELLSLFGHTHHEVTCLSIDTVMTLIKCYGEVFPNDIFIRLVSYLLTTTVNAINYFYQKYLNYADIRYYTLQSIKTAVCNVLDECHKRNTASGPNSDFIANTYTLLSKINMNEDMDKYWTSESLIVTKNCNVVFSNCWLAFLQLPLPSDIHFEILMSLHVSVIPYMTKPHLLVDYLVGSYDQGGLCSILSLNGLFILMHHYHLDYPLFYNKLYSLLNMDVFHVKHMTRFFKLLNMFLSSSHLPLYLVAAFAKRLARLLLIAPPQGVIIASITVVNLLRRHPNCKVLLHRNITTINDIECDPFIMETNDPEQCRALESCLWELKTLRSHYNPSVADIVNTLLIPEQQTKEESLHHHYKLTHLQIFMKEFATEKDLQVNYKTPSNFWD